MRRSLLIALAAPVMGSLVACTTGDVSDLDVAQVESANSGGWAGGGGDWGGGGGQWGGGGGLWGGGGGFWGGGGGLWGGGGGDWGGGGGQWGGGGGYWGGGGGWWGGGGGTWGGGGGVWGGGGGLWGGGGGLWGGGYANTFPFVGWSGARHWNFRGVSKASYTFNPAAPHVMSAAKDVTACPANYVRLGGFSYAIDVENWPAFVTLGYNKALCIPTPGNQGLTMNATVGDTSLTQAGGYNLAGTLANAANDMNGMKTMVGWGRSNVATQYGGSLCASIGSFAAAKRSCGVGLAFSDPNHKADGSLTQRGVTMNAAQAGSFSTNTPFGRNEGYGLYGAMANDMESYAGRVLQKHTTVTVPTSASGFDAWHDAHAAAFNYNGSNFSPIAMTASTNASKLQADAIRSLPPGSLNMIPVDPVDIPAGDPDFNKSVSAANGDLYAISLHSLAMQQSPLFGSGGGRWFFHSPADPNRPLMDLSSIFQGSGYVLTGQLTGTAVASQLANSYLSELTLRYADWQGEPAGTLYIDRAGQSPATVTTDADREARLAAAVNLARPRSNIGLGFNSSCAITSTGGKVKCWGNNTYGQLGNGTTGGYSATPVDVSGFASGAAAVTGGQYHTCAVTTAGALKCWGYNGSGQLGNGTSSSTPVTAPAVVSGLSTGVVAVAAGQSHTCALTTAGGVKCWGTNSRGQLGTGNQTSSAVPVDVSGLTSGVVQITAGQNYSCAVTSAGAAKCWGDNTTGQIGNGTSSLTAVTSPVTVSGMASGIASIAASSGWYTTCAVTKAGAAKCWGDSSYGQVGDGYTIQRNAPVPVTGLTSGVNSIVVGTSHTCALLSTGAVKCWGDNSVRQVGDGTNTGPRLAPTATNLGGALASSISAGTNHTCARISTGGIKCWGSNASNGRLGDGTTTTPTLPVNVSGTVSNANLIASQGTVLINKYATASGREGGHVVPVPWSMKNTVTGNQALMVSYDPLAVAAAMFIEQYDAHIAACNATTSESITEAEQYAGSKLWACSKATTKSAYLSGMATFLAGARTYLFGQSDGCLQSTQTVAGVACPVTKITWSAAHLPYTLIVPGYTTAGYNVEYGGQVATAVTSYQTALNTSVGTRLERTLQLAGTATFSQANALVTSTVQRAGNYGVDCVASDGFTYQ